MQHDDKYQGLREWPDRLEPVIMQMFFDAVSGRYTGDLEQAVMAGFMTAEYVAGMFLKHGPTPVEGTQRRRLTTVAPNPDQCRQQLEAHLSGGEGMQAIDWGLMLPVIMQLVSQLLNEWLKK